MISIPWKWLIRPLQALMPLLALSGNVAWADSEHPDWNDSTLGGDWGGIRPQLYERGFELTLSHKSDLMALATGGIKRGATWMGHTEASVLVDLDKLSGWEATSAYFQLLSDLGGKFNRDYAGTFVGADNIETSANTVQFYQAWMQRNFALDSFSLLAGLYPIDSEFYVTESSGLFLQPPYGMANDLAQSGVNGPPIFPLGALAMRFKLSSHDNGTYVQYAITDGVLGDPDNSYGTHVQLNKGDGTMSILEAGQNATDENVGQFDKTSIGYWRYTTWLEDLSDPAVHHPDQGMYFLAERTLAKIPSQAGLLSGFIRFGTASRDLHQADWTGSLGMHYQGIIAGRNDDVAGVAITVNHASSKFRQVYPGAASHQTQVEITYLAQVYPWLALQPTLQYFANPNMKLDANGTANLQNEWIAGVRLELEL